MGEYSEGDKLIVLDVDGVMTSFGETPGSYVTHGPSEYGVSRGPLTRLLRLVSDTGAKVVISSNWRRFDEEGPFSVWRHMQYGDIPNPLPKLKRTLGDCYLCDLPKDRHITKSEALRRWISANGAEGAAYVIFDDDKREMFQESEFAGRFVLTDRETGLTDEDCVKAKEILENG